MTLNKKQQVAYYNSGSDAAIQMNGMIVQGWFIKEAIPIFSGLMVIYEKTDITMEFKFGPHLTDLTKEHVEQFKKKWDEAAEAASKQDKQVRKSLCELIGEDEENAERSMLELTEDEYQLYKKGEYRLNDCKKKWHEFLRNAEVPINFIDWARNNL